MNELISAAKAVIDAEFVSQQKVAIANLRDAVNRAEKQEADFNTWWERTYGGKTCRAFAEDSWKTAQRFERERIRAIVKEMMVDDTWVFGDSLLERIDDV